MLCPVCKKALPEGTQFCDTCGTPVSTSRGHSQRIIAPKPVPVRAREEMRHEGSPRGLVIGAIALASIAAALIVVLQLRPKNPPTTIAPESAEPTPYESVESSANESTLEYSEPEVETPAPSVEESPATSASQTPEAMIASLDGWWAEMGGNHSDENGVLRYRSVWHVENGVAHTFDGYGKPLGDITLQPARVERRELLGGPGWYFHDLGSFKPDDRSDVLWRVDADGANYSGTSSHGRLDTAPIW
ncbi:MAG: zinc ribbon domain-containing protein [Atopobiaceae bacterium]|nr:zinc ribbon domain-containing protein [Atopobiaceae bacterium]